MMGGPQAKKFKPIQPAAAGEGSKDPVSTRLPSQGATWPVPTSTASNLPSRRPAVKMACEGCRRKRVKRYPKCDGQRPRCANCVRKNERCIYAGEEGETTSLALRRKNDSLEREKTRLTDLFQLLHSKPEEDALEILRRIRESRDPFTVLDTIRQAELLLPEAWSGHSESDQDTLDDSVIQVPARPWTAVAGSGVVSELVTNYFTWDGAYLFPSVDREVFVDEMRATQADEACWCTHLLVNAMCSQSSYTSARANRFASMTRKNITERFLDEAKAHLEEEHGRASIPTVQALMLMYLTTACLGQDRIGRIYRQIALDMVRRLQLETRYTSSAIGTPTSARDKRLIAKALWGLFLLESRIAFFYFEPSQIPPPRIPNQFAVDDAATGDAHGNVDVLGRPFEESPCEIPLVPGILRSACTISELFYEIMIHNTVEKTDSGDDSDIYIQKRLYSRLKRLEDDLPGRFVVENNFAPSTCFLRLSLNEAAFAIIQTLRHQTLFEMPASQPGTIIRNLCLHHCQSDIETVEASLEAWPFQVTHWRHLYLALQPLVLLLDEPLGSELFIRACRAMRFGDRTFHMCEYLLKATQAFAWAVQQPIPSAALRYLEEGRRGSGELGHRGFSEKEAHVSFALPQQDDIKDLLARGGRRRGSSIDIEEDIGALIENWGLH